ncbi:MAG: helix-turn-helix transcriptional regulator, partial [Clostridia bacterium]|nr:helix-turn-helix transcriptional regulator [Clostridia bacterium]
EYFRELFPDDHQKLLTVFDNPYFMPPVGSNEYIEKLLNRIETEYEVGDEMSEILIKGYLRELIIFIFRGQNAEGAPSIISGDSIIEKAAHYIIKNYNKNITLEIVSEFVHLSAGHFSKKFKAETGIGFKEYLVKIRIQKAAELLYETDDSVTEIAFKCGFNDSNYFGDAFTRIMRISPSRYRKMKRM